ncbi:hypothetical protein [Caudoviricetes sp.]|nr:hypothetical protein [Caudoviricetes sp.]
MAINDVGLFDQYIVDLHTAKHNWSSDTFKFALITNAVTPATTTADPRWGSGGSTNFDTNEVTAGGNYTAEGITLTSVSATLSGGKAVIDCADFTIAQNASNPTNARWGIIYNSTDAGKRAVAWVDLGSVLDLTTGDLVVTINAGGIYEGNQA